jgi:hypothetical protein
MALRWNTPVADLDGLLEGRCMDSGARGGAKVSATDAQDVLVVDDSVSTGAAMREARLRVEAADLSCNVRYVAIYGMKSTPPGVVDAFHEEVPYPRVFSGTYFTILDSMSAVWTLMAFCVATQRMRRTTTGPAIRHSFAPSHPDWSRTSKSAAWLRRG